MDIREAVKFGFAEYLVSDDPISEEERTIYARFYKVSQDIDYRILYFEFPNGYGASVIRRPTSYGGKDGLWELGVTKGGHLTYDTYITDDVLGHLTPKEVHDYLQQIKDLQPKEQT